jgi:hypothetical protein
MKTRDTRCHICGYWMAGIQIDNYFICDACNNKYNYRKKWCDTKGCHRWTNYRSSMCLPCEQEHLKAVNEQMKECIPQMIPDLRNIILDYCHEFRLQLWQISQ